MRPSFHPRLTNGPFDDPGLYIPFLFLYYLPYLLAEYEYYYYIIIYYYYYSH